MNIGIKYKFSGFSPRFSQFLTLLCTESCAYYIEQYSLVFVFRNWVFSSLALIPVLKISFIVLKSASTTSLWVQSGKSGNSVPKILFLVRVSLENWKASLQNLHYRSEIILDLYQFIISQQMNWFNLITQILKILSSNFFWSPRFLKIFDQFSWLTMACCGVIKTVYSYPISQET